MKPTTVQFCVLADFWTFNFTSIICRCEVTIYIVFLIVLDDLHYFLFNIFTLRLVMFYYSL